MPTFEGSSARTLLAILAIIALGACASTPSGIRQYIDEATAATITVAAQPIVFAQEHSDLAVNARDYLTLIPVDVNRSGHHATYWFGYYWTTIDRQAAGKDLAAERIVLVGDDREVELKRMNLMPHDVGLDQPPIERPGRAALTLLAETDAETLRFIGAATRLRAIVTNAAGEEQFELWRDGRSSTTAFARALPHE